MRNKKLIIIFVVLCSVTLLVVLNSVIFSVQHVQAYCFNVEDLTVEEEVLKHHGLKKGKSIFLVDEGEVKSNVEKNVPNVKVVNVERKFPNSVYINYVKVFEYFRVDCDDKSYFCSNEGKIVRISDLEDNTQIIKVIPRGKFLGGAQGDTFSTNVESDANIVTHVFNAMEKLDYQTEVLDVLELIDVSKNFIYLKTRTGVFFEIQSANNLLAKLQIALSAYNNLGAAEKKFGTIIVSDSTPPKASWSKENRYND